MRCSRQSVTGPVHYHCISRVVDRNFVFGTQERDAFRKIMRQVEAFSGVRVITWTILSNHFHVLLTVPPKPATPLSDQQILDRCRSLYSAAAMTEVEWEFDDARRLGPAHLDAVREKYLRRMWDLSEFMKTLKQKFTGWFNRTHTREGTLWERRFTDGLAIGSESFIEEVFEALRGAFSETRQSGARRMNGGDWGELRTARKLRVNSITPGAD